jgi:hypothetical protein
MGDLHKNRPVVEVICPDVVRVLREKTASARHLSHEATERIPR